MKTFKPHHVTGGLPYDVGQYLVDIRRYSPKRASTLMLCCIKGSCYRNGAAILS